MENYNIVIIDDKPITITPKNELTRHMKILSQKGVTIKLVPMYEFIDIYGEENVPFPDGISCVEEYLKNMELIHNIMPQKHNPIVKPPKIGRNDKCPCGSNKKYKKCCGY